MIPEGLRSTAIGFGQGIIHASNKRNHYSSIIANSANSHCNAFQVIQGFFLESVNAPEHIINVLAHGGWSVSVATIVNMVKALTKEQKSILRGLSTDGLCAITYD